MSSGSDSANSNAERESRSLGARPYVTLDAWTVEQAPDLYAITDLTVNNWIELGLLLVRYFKPEEVQQSR